MKRKIFLIIVIASLVLTLTFIYYNSSLNGEASGEVSGRVMRFVKKFIDPNNRIDETLFHAVIRKLAHFTEFGALGGEAMLLCMYFAFIFGRKYIEYVFCPLFSVLFAAVIDEFFQSFTGRTSSVRDVLIDFSGGTVGIIAVWIIVSLILSVAGRRKHEDEE